jgi:hypothetical protein
MELEYRNVEKVLVEKPIKLYNLNMWETHIFIYYHKSKETGDTSESKLNKSKIILYSKNKKNLKVVKK